MDLTDLIVCDLFSLGFRHRNIAASSSPGDFIKQPFLTGIKSIQIRPGQRFTFTRRALGAALNRRYGRLHTCQLFR